MMVASHQRYNAHIKYHPVEPEIRDSNASTSNEPDSTTATTAPAATTTTPTNDAAAPSTTSNDTSDSTTEATTDAPATEGESADPKAVIRRAANLDDNSLVGCMPGAPSAAPAPIIMTSIDRTGNDTAKPVAKVSLKCVLSRVVVIFLFYIATDESDSGGSERHPSYAGQRPWSLSH